MASEMFKAFAGVDLTHIPFRGASQATLAVASGEVDLMSMALSLAQPFLQDGKVRIDWLLRAATPCSVSRHSHLAGARREGV